MQRLGESSNFDEEPLLELVHNLPSTLTYLRMAPCPQPCWRAVAPWLSRNPELKHLTLDARSERLVDQDLCDMFAVLPPKLETLNITTVSHCHSAAAAMELIWGLHVCR